MIRNFNDAIVFALVAERCRELGPHVRLERCRSGAWIVNGFISTGGTLCATPFWDKTADLWITVDYNGGFQQTAASVPMPADGSVESDADFIVSTLLAQRGAIQQAGLNAWRAYLDSLPRSAAAPENGPKDRQDLADVEAIRAAARRLAAALPAGKSPQRAFLRALESAFEAFDADDEGDDDEDEGEADDDFDFGV